MRRREAFTIVELLVAFALIIFIMVILTEAFAAGLESFRQLKSIGDMQEKMRAVAILLRRDLQADHFDDDRGNRLRDIDLRATSAPYNEPPDHGYFRIWQGWDGTRSQAFNPFDPRSTIWTSTFEGFDSTLTPITRANDQGMAFTVRLRGPLPSDTFTAPLPGNPNTSPDLDLRTMCPLDFQTANVMHSQWAEVVYFVRPVGRTAGTTPLYALYRRQRLLGTHGNTVSIPPGAYDAYHDVSFSPTANASGDLPLNDPRTITEPRNRMGARPGPPPPSVAGIINTSQLTLEDTLGIGSPQAGDDLLLTDVVSFDIKVLYQGFPAAGDMPFFADLPPIVYAGTPNAPYQNSSHQASGYSLFDTWSKYGPYQSWDTPGQATSLPLKIRILALQITIRVHDSKTGLTRQTSIIQDM